MSEYSFPRLVRVLWTPNRKGSQRKSLAAFRLARDERDAWLIAQRLEWVMVPANAKRIVYQTAVMSRVPTTRDAHATDTQWETFFPEPVRAENVVR